MSTSTSHPLSRVLPSRPLGPMRSPARALGWFGIGLGLAELAMPRRMARIAGAPNLPTLTRAFGVREIGTGIGILASKDPSPWLWGRVAGDALDVATVGAGLVTRGRPLRTLTSMAMLIGIAYLDMTVAQKSPPSRKREKRSSRDYRGRSGFPRSPAEMRGIALQPSTPMGRLQGGPAPADASPAQRLMQAGEPASTTYP
ncbi:MAG TPA: hypothetical protein VLD35_09075 [Caldimonas sp.]|nr:hypothetical protein [Caldimonas sp.]